MMNVADSSTVRSRLARLCVTLGLVAIGHARAEVVLLDGETEAGLETWSNVDRATAEQKTFLPLAGLGSARIRVRDRQATKNNDQREHARRAAFPVTDWRPYDRLVVDVFNDSLAATVLRIEVNTPANEAQRYVTLPPDRWVRVEWPTADMDPELADISKVKDVQLAIDRQARETDIYVDSMVLLEPGETPPTPNAAFLDEARRSLQEDRERVARTHADRRREFSGIRAIQVADWAERAASSDLAELGHLLDAPDARPDALLMAGERLGRIERRLARVSSIVEFAADCDRAGTSRDQDVLVGVSDSMTKVFPREMPLNLVPPTGVALAAARNETESFQIGVLPLRGDLREVRVECGEMRSTAGDVLPHTCLRCDVTGYVETKVVPLHGSPLVGWWPDPILDFLGPVDVASGDLQSFWVRVRIPKEQPPGEYRGEVVVTGRGMSDTRIPLAIRVRSFAMPDVSPLPTAISFGPPLAPWSAILNDVVASPDWNAGLKYRWADFLADYYITFDHLYRRESPDFEVVDHLNRQGRLGAFNLGNVDVPKPEAGEDPDPVKLREMLDRVSVAYDRAKARGLLDHAFLYGFDEVREEWFDTVDRTAEAVREAMPGILIMTTTRDYDFGRKGWMKSIDAWCPTTDYYDPTKADEARRRGDQVWWYVCVGPIHPYANIFVEYPAIEPRLLMGAMAAKFRPDGFLYYQISLWKAKEPIRTGPFTTWDPRSYRTSHGDGSWVCMKEGGLPVPTIRLENYRDGLEDYAYARILAEAVRVKESKPAGLSANERHWLVRARAALEVPQDLVASLEEYSRDPALLAGWRESLAELIESSGEDDLDPWRGGFTLKTASSRGQAESPRP